MSIKRTLEATQLVLQKGQSIFTTSRIIADNLKRSYKNINDVIIRNEEELKEFGELRSRLIIAPSNGGMQEQKVYFLNREQATMLILQMRDKKGSRKVTEFKIKLVKEFKAMRDYITNLKIKHNDKVWIESREQGKLVRHDLTDTLKDLVDYAKLQGMSEKSMWGKMIYSNFTRLEYSTLFIKPKSLKNWKGLRDELDRKQLEQIKTLENLIEKWIKEYMKDGLNYKEIYDFIKERLPKVVPIVFGDKEELTFLLLS